MADTDRSIADILALFPDNSTGAVSPQDLRDMVVSLQTAYGDMYVSSALATTLGTTGTAVKAGGTTTAGILQDFSMPTDNRLRYDGAATRAVHAVATATILSTAVSQDITAYIYHYDNSSTSGAVVAKSAAAHSLSTVASEPHAITVQAQVEMDTNDYLEFWLANDTSSQNVTAQNMNLVARGVVN